MSITFSKDQLHFIIICSLHHPELSMEVNITVGTRALNVECELGHQILSTGYLTTLDPSLANNAAWDT